jgi:hypothetical protein
LKQGHLFLSQPLHRIPDASEVTPYLID